MKKRVFISIDIPDEIKKEISEIQKKIPEFKGKFIELNNLHLTLKFLGEQSPETIEKITEKLKEIGFSGFNCEVDSIGVFSEKYLRIVWLKIRGTEELQKIVDEKLSEIGFDIEKRFMGHLTIARVKQIKDKKEFLENLKKIKIPEMNFIVNEFRLKESILNSKGPEYSVLERYVLE